MVSALLAASVVGTFGITTVQAKSAAPRAAAKCAATPDTTIDKAAAGVGGGTGAGFTAQAIACAEKKAIAADSSLTPFVIGVQNPEGDPNGSFPEYSVMANAAARYINEELGGVGADYAKGKGGRPVKIVVCKMVITPASSQSCANDLAGQNVDIVFSTLNFFGNHFGVYTAKGIPVVVGTPITKADFSTAGVFAIGGGGGCLGTHTGLIRYATSAVLKLTKKPAMIGLPWANTAPGVFCYHDLEKKPIKILNGQVTTFTKKNKNAKLMPKLDWIGVPMLPAATDVTADVTTLLAAKPDTIIFSGQGSQCWTIVRKLLDLGWDPAKTPLTLSSSCTDLTAMGTLGAKIKGTVIVGSASILDPTALPKGSRLQAEAEVYAVKAAKYSSDTTSAGKGFGTAGFTGIMNIWLMANQAGGLKATGKTVGTFISKTSGHHTFAGTGLDCKNARKNAPYVATCNTTVSAQMWNGSKLKGIPAWQNFSGLDLIGGTDFDTSTGNAR